MSFNGEPLAGLHTQSVMAGAATATAFAAPVELRDSTPMHGILVVTDDAAMRNTLRRLFESEGHKVKTAAHGEEGLELCLLLAPSVVLLDLQLAENMGPRVFQQLQHLGCSSPVILLGKSSTADSVRFLDLGADDYVPKPFSGRELLARVRAVVRRSQRTNLSDTFVFGDIKVNFRTMELTRQGSLIPLTPREFKLLKFLTQNIGRATTRRELLNEVWGYHSYLKTRIVDNYIATLRRKLESDRSHPAYFKTIHGIGYRFVPYEKNRRQNES